MLARLIFAAALLFCAPAMAAPNFVIILADDLGQGGWPGSYPTPNLDALAEQGVTYANGYSTGAMCTPTRAGLLTGRYQSKIGVVNNVPRTSTTAGLPLKETTLAEALKARGYVTGMVGKWHLGNTNKLGPLAQGFDEFFGILEGEHAYVGGTPLRRGTVPVPASGLITDAFGREAASFIRQHKAQKFFLYLPFTAPHRQPVNPQLPFAEMMAGLDRNVGVVMDALRDSGVADNTVVVFLGDNGCDLCSSAPFRGEKGTWYEGGVRVPFVVRWPGSAEHVRSDVPVASIDLFPTFLKAAGGTPAAIVDGADIRSVNAARPLFFGKRTGVAVRKGKWKLVGKELYDLDADIGERRNVAAANPAIVKELNGLRSAWSKTNRAPLW